MNRNEKDVRQCMIKATIELLNEIPDIEKITVRQIAKRAKVGVGSINYHFNSKDNLLSIAVRDVLAEMAINLSKPTANLNLNPRDRLKTMLKELCNAAVTNEKLTQFMVTHDILSGNMHALLYIIPILKEIFKDKKEEIELRVIALQILQPLQVAAIAPTAFCMYSSFNLYDKKARNQFIDQLLDNLINERKE
ncbi:TetR family transcriptional regulator [Lachnotalea glycerini]|uniref:TetR family transcriptional regulator n=1 Tax=Lachnotalea glycerini TaxID=1763509 RepID=A0A255IJI2_9FIRM|nr:TetR/AcrR family transcriptional regulator [Lachnotalea glycerini]PXV95621.1 TetR family transcriptional regulator [Lachnotalea glycerini]RDY32911.1 TetR/AcrR family transcriptional regulator [Lachnotalea glycerini]